MASNLQPIIGDWYQNNTGETFEVVAYDPEDQNVEIQYFDGAVEELDLDTWVQIPLRSAEPPEDWSGSYDISREDYGVDLDQDIFRTGNPLDDFEAGY